MILSFIRDNQIIYNLIRAPSNYQDFLKTVAILTMLIDHLGYYFFTEYQSMRCVGCFSMPIFCFFVGYNFDNIPRTRVLIIGLCLYLFTIILFKSHKIV
ncbi:TraX family protein [Candidatus Tisiphia endosymbiont of Nemotelus uliginosus]|uniref:TraX family protein n=1 Tax=Candidatus Tisiphia endosymbiont of Nemotelus uliginosus TaxID=3077926 RepID=UPI0035C91038